MPRTVQGEKWDEATQSFSGRTTDEDGNTIENVHRFIDKDTREWRHVARDSTGKIVFEAEATGKRKSTLTHPDVKDQEAKAPPAEMKVLERMVGKWHEEGVMRIAEGRRAETHMTYTSEFRSILGGHFILQRASDKDGKVVIMTIRTFDPERQEYRQWLFDSNGSASEVSGQWDESTDTLTFTDKGQETTGIATIRFPDEETTEWEFVSKDEQGKVYLHTEGKSVRQK
jgi:hypothetical protein